MTNGVAEPASARLVLVTGKGGVGKSTVAAATAIRCAELGLRTCVASADAAHSLGDVFDIDIGGEACEIGPNLWAQHIDARRQLAESWGLLRDYLGGLVRRAGLSEVQAAELAVVPGLEDVMMLASVVELADLGTYDVVVVDCAPSAETIRLLSLPHVLGWWLEQILPVVPDLGPLVPFVENGLGIPVPGRDALSAGQLLLDRLRAAQGVLNDPSRTCVRLVTTAEPVVTAETRRTASYLSLFGYVIDAVVANRLVPETTDPQWVAWRAEQQQQLTQLEVDLAPAPVLHLGASARPPMGMAQLAPLGAELYGAEDPTGALATSPTLRFDGTAAERLRLTLSGVYRGEVQLQRRGSELRLSIGPYTRVVALPDVLVDRPVTSARVLDHELIVDFATAAARVP